MTERTPNEQRLCLRGHGPMQAIEGEWMVTNYQEPPAWPGQAVKPPEAIYTFRIYRCPVCRALEMVDTE